VQELAVPEALRGCAINMKKDAFTITELMIVIVLIGVIAGFALPNFSKAVLKAQARDAMSQLEGLYAANKIYRAQNNTFWVATAGSAAAINAGPLNLNIVPSTGVNYTYTGVAATFRADAVRGGASPFTIRISQSPINPVSLAAANPCCIGAYCANFSAIIGTVCAP
jgi:prepilin-type N-terminal cleavage/methylation domain-containing protein